jgi:hypothetical protein
MDWVELDAVEVVRAIMGFPVMEGKERNGRDVTLS